MPSVRCLTTVLTRCGARADGRYAAIRVALEKAHQSVHDMLIAAEARAIDAVSVTDDLSASKAKIALGVASIAAWRTSDAFHWPPSSTRRTTSTPPPVCRPSTNSLPINANTRSPTKNACV